MRVPVLVGIAVLTVMVGACSRATVDKAVVTNRTFASPRQVVGASGMVVASSAAEVRFCSGPFALTWGPPHCSPGIKVTGVNLSRLSYRASSDGVTWGSAYLAGTFRDGILRVTEQGRPKPDNTELQLVEPPCPAPAGGWATAAQNDLSTKAVSTYRRQFPADVTSVAIFRPTPTAWVVTVASTNPRRTLARLSSAYPDRLCVVRSRYQLSSVRSASAAAQALLSPIRYGQPPYRITGVGLTTGTDGQPIVDVSVVADTTALRRALASEPAGLVRIVPWLQPVAR